MSELTRMIDRLTTQRACLEYAATLIADVPGCVLELGLGKARTYDHLKHLLPQRQILAFDRELHAPARLVPPPDELVLGEFRLTLAGLSPAYRQRVALVHADVGSEDPEIDARNVGGLVPLLEPLLCGSAIVVGDRPMPGVGWLSLPPPPSAGGWPYYLYRVTPPSG